MSAAEYSANMESMLAKQRLLFEAQIEALSKRIAALGA